MEGRVATKLVHCFVAESRERGARVVIALLDSKARQTIPGDVDATVVDVALPRERGFTIPGDGHPSEDGHRHYALTLEPVLRAMLDAPPAP